MNSLMGLIVVVSSVFVEVVSAGIIFHVFRSIRRQGVTLLRVFILGVGLSAFSVYLFHLVGHGAGVLTLLQGVGGPIVVLSLSVILAMLLEREG